jgi:outer membrane lipoprotein-sorting protein
MKKILLVFALLISGIVFAQSAKKAEQLLEDVVNKTASYKNMKVDISYTMVNKEMDINEKKEGLIYISGDSYRIEMEGQIIISDGKTVWTYLEDSEEVMVSNVEDNDESISPTKILTTYNSNYKAKFDTDSKYKNADLKAISLRPNDGKQFEKMSILVNQKSLSLESFSIYDKNGNVFTYHIINLTPNLDLPDNTFTFNPAEYPDVEVIDMR